MLAHTNFQYTPILKAIICNTYQYMQNILHTKTKYLPILPIHTKIHNMLMHTNTYNNEYLHTCNCTNKLHIFQLRDHFTDV